MTDVPSEPTTPADTYSNTLRAVGITFSNILTQDKAMLQALKRAQAAAASDVSVLILGETGTGKNLVAQAIHNGSSRVDGPFVSLNCTALPESLLESELFGHEAHAFTDARTTRHGAFERAHKGSLFLDEIGEMSTSAQAKVLHASEYKQFHRVGGETLLSADVRIISATNAQLERYIEEKRFRADLYYRLAEVTIRIPPLRERKDDIPIYVDAFLEEASRKWGKQVKRLSRSAVRLLRDHDWPGNVRELRAVLRSAVTVCQARIVEASDVDLSPVVLSDVPGPAGAQVWGRADMSLDSVEAHHIKRVLDAVHWHKREAARVLGISRPTLDRKIRAYHLEPPQAVAQEDSDVTPPPEA